MTERVDAAALRAAGRAPATPFSVALADGSCVVIERLLRVLPGKRIVGEGCWNGRHVLAKLFVANGSVRHWTQERSGIEALSEAGRLERLLPVDALLAGHERITLEAEDAGRFLSGLRRRGPWPDLPAVAVYGEEPPALLGVGHVTAGELIPDRLLSPLEIQQILQEEALPS